MQEEKLNKTLTDETENSNEEGRISLLFDFCNSEDFKIILDIDNANESAASSFALFLSLLESNNKIYELVLRQIHTIIKDENDPEVKKTIANILTIKKNIDYNMDIPAVLPRDVFRRINNPGV